MGPAWSVLVLWAASRGVLAAVVAMLFAVLFLPMFWPPVIVVGAVATATVLRYRVVVDDAGIHWRGLSHAGSLLWDEIAAHDVTDDFRSLVETPTSTAPKGYLVLRDRDGGRHAVRACVQRDSSTWVRTQRVLAQHHVPAASHR